jgi:vancomycin resistance protein YoaR
VIKPQSMNPGGTRSKQHGAILLGLAGGMLVVAGGFAGAYYVLGTKSVAVAATAPSGTQPEQAPAATSQPRDVSALLGKQVALKFGATSHSLTWAELGAEADPDEAARAGNADLTALAAKGAIPVRIDREKAVKALLALKAKTDRAPINAYLDLEEKKIFDDQAGSGLDVWGTLPRLAAAARSGAPSVELAIVKIPANVTKAALGIEDISNVMGHYVTKFPVADRDRNFNLKLAASKLNGVVLKPGEEFSFNATVGERSQKNGYKVAHVITAGEMVDGLAGGTCQISTTLFGASFFAGIDIVDTRNHSRPSAYTPLGFDATVVWPNTDLKLKNPYDFPVVVRYVVANGEAKVEILGKKRPYDKISFERHIIEETPFTTEERLDEEMAEGESSHDQEGFPGFRIQRVRHFYKDNKVVKTNKWILNYKPVTEYIRKGTSTAPDAKKAVQKPSHGPQLPKGTGFSMSQ